MLNSYVASAAIVLSHLTIIISLAWGQVHVYPLDHEKAQAAIAATHTMKPKGEQSRREKRLAFYKGKPRPSQLKKEAEAKEKASA